MNAAEYIIEDYKIHHGKVSRIYSEFNQMGKNSSLSVLSSFRTIFRMNVLWQQHHSLR
ncbi:ABC-three component system protein [Salmonella enterica]|uniref:ABC-three component system protein n=1 Tax=Salmonella enterica TaxID=28901 RepID=UPI0032E3592C